MEKKILSQLIIEKIVVHDVPKHKKDDFANEVTYSENISETTDELKQFFKTKIIEALSSDRSMQVCYDSGSSSPVPVKIQQMLDKSDNFVELSKDITKHMFTIQTGQNSGGLLVFFHGLINSKNCIVILKVERDTGAQLKLNTKTHSIDIVQVKDIMLTEKTKLYKACLFINQKDFSATYDGLMMDYQTIDLTRIFAHFFMYEFLGCRPYQDPRTATKAFYEATKEFINTTEDPILKAKYIQDINSYLQKNTDIINPSEFAKEYLSTPKEMDEYKSCLERNNVPFTTIQKNLQFISTFLKHISIKFENDVEIIARDGDIGNKVKLEELPNGQHKAEIISKIRNVK